MLSFETVCKTCEHVYLYGDISSKSTQAVKKQIFSAIKNIKANEKSGILLHLNTHGGDLDCTIYLMNLLSDIRYPIFTVNDSQAHSCGAFLFTVGCQRFMFENSRILFHSIRKVLDEDEHSLQSAISSARRIKIVYDTVIRLLSYSPMSMSLIKKLMKTERLLDGKAAFKLDISSDLLPHINIVKRTTKRDISLIRLHKTDISSLDFIYPSLVMNAIFCHFDSQSPLKILFDGPIFEDPESIDNSIVFSNYLSMIPSICVIAAPISTSHAIIAISTDMRFMFKNCWITLSLNYSFGGEFNESIANTRSYRDLFFNIFRQRTHISMYILHKATVEPVIITSEQALKWGIVHELI